MTEYADPRGSDKMQTMTESENDEQSRGADQSAGADVALARSQAQMAELAAKHGANPQEGKAVVLSLEDVSVVVLRHRSRSATCNWTSTRAS